MSKAKAIFLCFCQKNGQLSFRLCIIYILSGNIYIYCHINRQHDIYKCTEIITNNVFYLALILKIDCKIVSRNKWTTLPGLNFDFHLFSVWCVSAFVQLIRKDDLLKILYDFYFVVEVCWNKDISRCKMCCQWGRVSPKELARIELDVQELGIYICQLRENGLWPSSSRRCFKDTWMCAGIFFQIALQIYFLDFQKI
jgi:hypothetical protein